MTPALAIASLDALPAAIATWRPDLVVSIHSPFRPMTRPWMGPWLSMAFQDREALAPMGPGMGAMVARVGMPRAAMGHARPMALPMPSHVSAIVEVMKAHAEAHGQDMGGHGLRLLINCHAGLGRSPAMGIVALMAWGMAAEAAVRAVAAAVPEASPNRLVLRHAEALMGQAIVVHAEAAWAYRRGPAGAQGEPVGLREVGGPPPQGSSLAKRDPTGSTGRWPARGPDRKRGPHPGSPPPRVPTPRVGVPTSPGRGTPVKFEIGLLQRAYAKRRGVSPKAVRNALGSEAVPGRIRDALLPDGTINADLADRLWEANTDPSQRRGREAERAAASMRAAETKSQASPSGRGEDSTGDDDDADGVPTPPPVRRETFEEDPPRRRPPVDVSDALEDHLRRNRGEDEDAEDEEGGEFSDNPTMLALAIKEKREKVRKLKLANDKEEKSLVARSATWSHFYAVVAGISEAWQVWPDKVGPELAGKYGADAFAFTQDLKEAVREHLKILSSRDAKAAAAERKDG